jgi:hypothetical protein
MSITTTLAPTGDLGPSPTTPDGAGSRTMRLCVLVAIGLGVGIATALLQAQLGAPWASLVNAASPWLVGAFVVGTMWAKARSAAFAGLVVCLLELIGYYATAGVRGYSASHTELAFWGICGVVGGPALGAAGWLWWRGPGRLQGLGPAILAASFLSEAAIGYGWRLRYLSTAVLFASLGVAVIALLGIRRHQHADVAKWLAAALPVGILAELLLGLVYQQSFT